MNRAALTMVLAASLVSDAGAQATSTDIYLAPLSRAGDSLVVGPAINVTKRIGYDNQPSFTPDSKAILFTAQSDGQTDIWRYDLATRTTTRLISTPESEYSATVMPGGARFSVIRVERDSTQRLWSFAMDGSDPQLVLRDLKPVGYHLWLDSVRLAAFVLGSPSTLHLINRDGTRDTVVARDIGRALQRAPSSSGTAFSFTQRDSAGRLQIMVHEPALASTTPSATGSAFERRMRDAAALGGGTRGPLTAAAPDNEYHVWTTAGLMTATGSVLHRLAQSAGGASVWIPLADLKLNGLRSVSRLAASSDGNWLAFVAEPASP